MAHWTLKSFFDAYNINWKRNVGFTLLQTGRDKWQFRAMQSNLIFRQQVFLPCVKCKFVFKYILCRNRATRWCRILFLFDVTGLSEQGVSGLIFLIIVYRGIILGSRGYPFWGDWVIKHAHEESLPVIFIVQLLPLPQLLFRMLTSLFHCCGNFSLKILRHPSLWPVI